MVPRSTQRNPANGRRALRAATADASVLGAVAVSRPLAWRPILELNLAR